MTRIEQFIEAVRITDNSIDIIDITVEPTTKGNWAVSIGGNYSMTIAGHMLTHEEADEAGILNTSDEKY
jgi:hypothetical protein